MSAFKESCHQASREKGEIESNDSFTMVNDE